MHEGMPCGKAQKVIKANIDKQNPPNLIRRVDFCADFTEQPLLLHPQRRS